MIINKRSEIAALSFLLCKKLIYQLEKNPNIQHFEKYLSNICINPHSERSCHLYLLEMNQYNDVYKSELHVYLRVYVTVVLTLLYFLLGLGTKAFVQHATSKMQEFMYQHQNKIDCQTNADTWVYPVLQMGSFNVNQEHDIMKTFLESCKADDQIYVSTAYFNPLENYVDIMTDQSKSEYHLLTASPQVRFTS